MKDCVQSQKIGTDRAGDHGYSKAQELVYDMTRMVSPIGCIIQGRGKAAHAGTAGAMLDLSEALGVLPSPSSFSRRFFSVESIRLEVMFGDLA